MTDWGALLRAHTTSDTIDRIDTTTSGEGFVSSVDCVAGVKGRTSQVTGAEGVRALTSLALVKAAADGAPHPWFTAEAALAGLATDTGLTPEQLAQRDWPASAWRRLHSARLEFWRAPRSGSDGSVRRYENPDNLAFSDIVNKWRVKHWQKPPPGICAACKEPLGGDPSRDLGGYAVHAGRDPDCLNLHYRQWRTEGMKALALFGIKSPDD